MPSKTQGHLRSALETCTPEQTSPRSPTTACRSAAYNQEHSTRVHRFRLWYGLLIYTSPCWPMRIKPIFGGAMFEGDRNIAPWAQFCLVGRLHSFLTLAALADEDVALLETGWFGIAVQEGCQKASPAIPTSPSREPQEGQTPYSFAALCFHKATSAAPTQNIVSVSSLFSESYQTHAT